MSESDLVCIIFIVLVIPEDDYPKKILKLTDSNEAKVERKQRESRVTEIHKFEL